MTSAVLAGRNEVHPEPRDHRPWSGVRGASLKPKPPVPPSPRRHRPGPNPNPAPRSAAVPSQELAPSAAPPSTSRCVTIRMAGMTRLEARQAQARLTGELGRVRAMLARIDTWQSGTRREAEAGTGRRASPTPPSLRAAMLKRCGQILTRLRKNRVSQWFKAPVDVEGLKLYDYHAIIRNPMDLGTVKVNLAGGRYPSHEEFAADVRLTFNNALRYNPPGHQVHTAAGNLLANFEGMYKEAMVWFEQEFQRLEPPMPLALPPPPQQPVPGEVLPRMGGGRRPKPKAREPNKEMDVEKKEKLREEIENLPYDQIDNVLEIVQKRNSVPALKGEEVELDFEVMDAETLWELDRFVLNWRNSCNKRRQSIALNGDAAVTNCGMVDVTVVPDEDDMVKVGVNPPIVVEIGDSEGGILEQATEADTVDEYVDIGDEKPTVNYQSIEIEKDTQMASSSSESGSGSSSSNDSCSKSSADSDSDGDDARSPD